MQINRSTKYIFILLFTATFVVFSQSISDPIYIFKTTEQLLRPYDLKGLLKALVYVFSYVLCIVAIILVLLQKANVVAYAGSLLLSAAIGFHSFYQLLGNPIGFTINEVQLLVHETGQAKYAIQTYYDLILIAVLVACLAFSLLLIIRNLISFRVNLLFALVLPLSIFVANSAKNNVGLIDEFEYPPLHNITMSFANYFFFESHLRKFYDRDQLKFSDISNTSSQNHILYIIDESVSGDGLSINGFPLNTTPLLESLVKNTADIVNYGVVNSASNASAWSNLLQRTGLSTLVLGEFKKNISTLPTIFQYAKNAGYKTQLIDAQSEVGQLQNYLTLFDTKFIDKITYRNPKDIYRDRDFNLTDSYLDWTASDQNNKTFTIFVRAGAHWPWANKYPPNFEKFKPALKSTYGGTSKNKGVEIVNTYSNALLYSVDYYLDKYIYQFLAANMFVIYTADHGVSILGDTVPRLHASVSNIPPEEFSVPLMIFSRNVDKKYHSKSDKKYSQSQAFSTMLVEMGYSTDEVEGFYGPTLAKGWPDEQLRQSYITGKSELVDFDP